MDTRREHVTATLIQSGLLIIAGLCLLGAVLHALNRLDLRLEDPAIKLLAISLVALAFGQITKFKGFGIEIEKQVAQLSDTVGKLEKEVGPGSKSAAVPSVSALPAIRASTRLPDEEPASDSAANFDPEDPNKNRFGGRSETESRRMTARITPESGPASSRCRVAIRIESTDPGRPLGDRVELHLHPTFGQWSVYAVPVLGGVVREEIISYGAFTIGARLEDGTLLELDLMDVPGGTPRFYEE